MAAVPAEDLNDVGLKLGLLLDEALCGGIREEVQAHHFKAIGTALAFILRAQGVMSDTGRRMLHEATLRAEGERS